MAKFFSFCILLSAFVVLSFSFMSPAFAATDCEEICADSPFCPGDSGYNYRCSGACPNSKYQRQYWEYSCWPVDAGWNTECGCYTSYSCDCSPINYGSWGNVETCNSWQECSLTPVAGSHCVCQGDCLGAPTNPSPDSGEQNVKLPVTLGWGSVPGAASYRYKIDDVLENSTTSTNVPIDEERACLLKSNTDYNWGAKACCTPDGTDGAQCGTWSSWNFKTSLAPQPFLPTNNAADIPVPVTFVWCPVGEAQSYYLRFYKNGRRYIGPALYPTIVTKEEGVLNSAMSLGWDFLTKDTLYKWEVASCLRENGLQCGENCLENEDGDKCGEYGQRWSFTTIGQLSTPIPISPKSPNGFPVVNLSDSLKWEAVQGTFSYRYEIKEEEIVRVDLPANFNEVLFNVFWEYLDFDTPYSWRVKSCWDEEGESCEDAWSESWSFKTTGAKPTSPDVDNTIIPIKLGWDDMPGAASYYYEVATNSEFANIVIPEEKRVVKQSEVSAGYPSHNIRQGTSYYWRVKTCADERGEVCGEWSDIRDFLTFRLERPVNPYPIDGGELPTYEHYLKWDTVLGARFYQYKVDLGGTEKIPLTIVPSNSAFVPTEQLELGEYIWYVRACLDKGCNETGDLAGPWRFTLVEKIPPGEGGLVPCGRYANVPDPYDIDEREPCGFKHLFLLLRNIIDFILWRLGLIVLALLSVATGVIFYFSMGAPETMAKVKSIWKSAGLGYLIIFLGYTFINITLAILGYKIGVFGPWWVMSF